MIAGISSPYYSLIFNAIEKVAAKDGYSVVYFSDNKAEHHPQDQAICSNRGYRQQCG